MSVCFSGYRPEKLPWGGDESDPRCAVLKKRLYDAAESACAEGYRHFICGMARGVDLYACEAVLQLREKYRDVTVEAAIPCPSQPEGWPEEEQRRWHDLVDRCDYETVVQDHYDAAAKPLHGGPSGHAHRSPRRTVRRPPPYHRICPAPQTGCGHPAAGGGVKKEFLS